MIRLANQKRRVLNVMKLLLEQTDEQHGMTMSEICNELKNMGITCERKAVYSDIDALRQFGLDIILTKGSHFGYFVGSRSFELPELKLLVDAVQSSRFITSKKSRQLIGKLEGLASIHEARKLKRQVFIDGRLKTVNENVYYSIDQLYEAIAAEKQVVFRYFEYTLDKRRQFRRNGHLYQVSPYALHWDNDKYYLIAHYQDKGLYHFRVDKIADITPLAESILPLDKQINLVQYVRQSFSMFGGQKERVRVRFAHDLIGVVLDRFGTGTIIEKLDDTSFMAEFDAQVSQTFLSWIFQFGSKAQILAPEGVVGQMGQMIRDLIRLYPAT